MKRRLTLLSLALATLLPGAHAAPNCQFEKLAAGSGGIGPWIDKGNWLAVENQRLSLSAGVSSGMLPGFVGGWRHQALGCFANNVVQIVMQVMSGAQPASIAGICVNDG